MISVLKSETNIYREAAEEIAGDKRIKVSSDSAAAEIEKPVREYQGWKQEEFYFVVDELCWAEALRKMMLESKKAA